MKTRNIDLAAVLMCYGFTGTLKRIHDTHAEVTFPKDKEINRVVERFLRGKVEVNITNFLYHRLSLKNETKKQGHSALPTKTGSISGILSGTPYWFVTGTTVYKQLWGSAEVHNQRLQNGNVFLTEAEAKAHVRDLLGKK